MNSSMMTRRGVARSMAPSNTPVCARPSSRRSVVRVSAAAASQDKNLGFETMRDGIKVAADESVLSPRFYTTDFAEMERMFSLELNPNLYNVEVR